MKVALINPGTLKIWASGLPLHLGYIASYLQSKNHTVKIIDQLAGDDVIQEIDDFKPDIAGLTATTPLATDAYKIAEMLKAKGILTVMGGVHASVMTEESLRHVDMVVKGYGELTMEKIINEGITQGVVEGVIPKDLDEIPLPARHLMSPDYFHTPQFVPNYPFVKPGQRLGQMISSRGCVYRCIYCHNSTYRPKVLFHSAERVLEEIESLYHEYNVNNIFFMDDNFLLKKDRLESICSSILSKGLKISFGVQATSNEIDDEKLSLLKQAGCKQMVFGFESGSQRVLDILEKRTTVEKNIYALKKAKEYGFITQSYFLIGNPDETEEDLKLTKKFVFDHKEYLDSIMVSFLTPFPGTKLWNDMKQKNMLPDEDTIKWSDVRFDRKTFETNPNLSQEILQNYYFELLSIAPPKLGTIFSRFLSDPLGVLDIVRKTDKKEILRTLYQSLKKR